ncbi:MAG: YajQ family cyclic di-GMP-binding protein [Alphaproteobacteria bacterium]|nr:YajQ family cyclic di-GMP-binding protein [Alphaproteobacteria bacterium]
MPSFDVVSETNMSEVDNALQMMSREISQRYDFKGSKSSIERDQETLTLVADDDYKLGAMHDLLKIHLTRRNVDTQALDFKTKEAASGNTIRQKIIVKQGIDQETAKTITKEIKASKMKVQASIQGDTVRITGKKRDDLQEAIAHIKTLKIQLPLQYINFRD